MTTYLVTGASGFLGGELVGRLLQRDDAADPRAGPAHVAVAARGQAPQVARRRRRRARDR